MSSSAQGKAIEKTTQPTTLKRRLPKATRRPPPGVRAFTRSARRPLPRLAPSTRQSATGTETTFEAASVAASSTTARLDHDSTAKAAPISMSSIGSPESVAKITRTPCASVMGLVASITSCSASSMRPRPIATRPSWPAFELRRDRKKTTPKMMSSGESHERSSEKTCARSAVPTSAPSMIGERGAESAIRFCETNELAMSAVALEDCTRPVTPRPARNAEKRLETLFERTRRRSAPKTRRMPGAHDVRAPHEEGHAGEEVEERLHPRLTPRQAESLEVGEALHRFLHAFLVAQPRVLDAAEGRELQAVARAPRAR